MPLGLYISVPFCRSKCSYCNFASNVFSRSVFEKYVARLCAEVKHAGEAACQISAHLPGEVDTIYFGGGTPTLLDATQLDRIFLAIRQNFAVQPGAELTMECAPGTLSDQVADCFLRNGVNRVSLGVQSFIDQEARSVGRLHDHKTVLNDIARLRSAGISNINVDLIAGLPHQTMDSWQRSLDQLLATEVPHASVYMLEVDEDSRLGQELIAGGQKYHAHFVPDDDLAVEMYELACARLNAAGIQQYEISNFARAEFESKHNLKYWTRQPYLGFGVDAHSMLFADSPTTKAHVGTGGLARPAATDHVGTGVLARPATTAHVGTGVLARPDQLHSPTPDSNAPSVRGITDSPDRGSSSNARAIRFSNPDTLDEYLQCAPATQTIISAQAALEESFFLGLRLTRGVNLRDTAAQFGNHAIPLSAIAECIDDGLLERDEDYLRLTAKGRLLSNEVFKRFIAAEPAPA